MKMLNDILSRASFCFLCGLMTYAVLLGVGNPVSIGGLSLWMILLCLFALTGALPVLCNLGKLLKSIYFWILIAFGAWVVFAAVRGYLAGNDIGIILRDLSGLLYFVLFPFIYVILCDRKRVLTAMRVMMYAALGLALLLMASFLLYLLAPGRFEGLKNYFIGINYLNYTRISAKIPRLLFVCMPFQLFGCAFSIYFQMLEDRFSVRYAAITGICLGAMVLTFTRALYLSAAVAAFAIVLIFLICCGREKHRKLLIHIGASLAAFLLMMGALGICGGTNYLDYAVKRALVGVAATETPLLPDDPSVSTVPSDSEREGDTVPLPDQEAADYLNATSVSDQYRGAIKQELTNWIRRAPIIGNGMGISLELKKDWPEYSYLDLTAKMGIIGLIFYFLPVLLMVLGIIRDYRHGRTRLISGAWLAVMAGLMCYSIFQPYLNNIQCVFVYCCAICAHCAEKERTAV